MKAKNDEKGAYKRQNEGNGTSKIFALKNNQKVSRAYESLNPALSRWGSTQEVLLNVPSIYFWDRNPET
jgi:hypothetical protein